MASMYAEDAVWDVSGVFTDVPPAHGHDSMRRHWKEMHDAWGGIRLAPVEGFVVGEDRYVVVMRVSGVGRQSGVEVDQEFAIAYWVRPSDQKIIRAQMLPDSAAAISAAESAVPGRV